MNKSLHPVSKGAVLQKLNHCFRKWNVPGLASPVRVGVCIAFEHNLTISNSASARLWASERGRAT